MSKMDSYMQGRTEGMEFALRLVKDKGIEELEKEIKFRQRTGISLNVTRQELNAASNKIKEMTLDTYSILSVACLCDLWGFGKKRCQQFMDKMAEGAQYLVDDLATWDDYRQAIQERLLLLLMKETYNSDSLSSKILLWVLKLFRYILKEL